jgi:thiol-disulfide isomerase/thioredoxin
MEFSKQGKQFVKDPQEIAKWISQNVKLNTTENYYGQVISPEGILKTKEADRVSREVFFVAICRSLGIAARYEWATGRSQYMLPNKGWQYATFGDEKAKVTEPMTNVIVTSSSSNDTKPEYFYHFALSKLTNGRFQTLDYEYDMPFSQFPDTLSLSNGYYRLLTGRRADDGSVFVREEYFYLTGSDTTVCITLPKVNTEPKVIAHSNLQSMPFLLQGDVISPLQAVCTDKNVLLMFVNPANEPTRHLIADFKALKTEFENTDVCVIAAVCGDNSNAQIAQTMKDNFPNQTMFQDDSKLDLLNRVTKAINYDFGNNFPLLVVMKPNGDVIFISEGYRIAAPDSILKLIRSLSHKQ